MLIYLIDEDPISLFLTELVLRAEESELDIHSFTAAEEALAYLLPHLATAVPQIILLDLNMPVLDGWDFLAALTPYEAALQSHCHIYLLTSSLALADRVKAQNYALVAGVIRKPLEEEEVQAMLAAIQGNAGKADSKPEA